MQAAKAVPSKLHSNRLPASLLAKLKVAPAVTLGWLGCPVIVVAGAVVSVVTARL